MQWERQGQYRWKREDGEAHISVARVGGQIWYTAWVKDASEWRHPQGWRRAAVVMQPEDARASCEAI